MKKWLIPALILASVGLYANDSLDRPLSSVGLNTSTCIEPLLGSPQCGDDAIAFCRERYDPDINADVCGEVLSEAGVSVAAVERDRAAAARDEEAAVEERVAREEREREQAEREEAAFKQGGGA